MDREWQSIVDWFPNWPHSEMPSGEGPEENVEECAWLPGTGYVAPDLLGKEKAHQFMPQRPPHAGSAIFPPLHYSVLGERLGIDSLQGAQVSGSRFAYIVGDLALMQSALQSLLMDKLVAEGYEQIIPPLVVRARALYGTSHFPEGREQVYEIQPFNVEDSRELFLVGSSEPSNFSYFMDRTVDGRRLPIKLFAATTCFRSEAGSWGRDTKGIKRVHQFDKIELNAVCRPEQADGIYEEFRRINEWFLQSLQLPYRIVNKCAGDAGYLATHRQRDIEVWLSGSQEFMELMTDTDTSDYQARRLGIRYREEGGATRFCNTVNDTGCAMGRTLIAIIDNYQQSDGSVRVPELLRSRMRKDLLEARSPLF